MATENPRAEGPAWREIESSVDEALESLDDELKAPVMLYYLRDKSQSEIAAELGVDQSTVSRTLSRGVEALRVHLARGGTLGTWSASL